MLLKVGEKMQPLLLTKVTLKFDRMCILCMSLEGSLFFVKSDLLNLVINNFDCYSEDKV